MSDEDCGPSQNHNQIHLQPQLVPKSYEEKHKGKEACSASCYSLYNEHFYVAISYLSEERFDQDVLF
jgi:hypothetical protein